MNVFEKHQLAIAKKTLKLSDAGVFVLRGMTTKEARKILSKGGLTSQTIRIMVGYDKILRYTFFDIL